ncbi:hypothetical protein F4780DRAFT_366737 [Xylariomycetidae sp. FL0641]|nr:hypothetical protein F4780DRAFT_366737 [Xylariomycetidae sp. FL0641]
MAASWREDWQRAAWEVRWVRVISLSKLVGTLAAVRDTGGVHGKSALRAWPCSFLSFAVAHAADTHSFLRGSFQPFSRLGWQVRNLEPTRNRTGNMNTQARGTVG